VCVRDNLVIDSLIYLEPVERLKKRSKRDEIQEFWRQHEQQSSGQLKDEVMTSHGSGIF